MNIVNTQNIGLLIRKQRKSLGLSQAKLAEKTMVSRDWVVQLEKGKETAEIGLVLRTLKTLDLAVEITPKKAASPKNIALADMMKKLGTGESDEN